MYVCRTNLLYAFIALLILIHTSFLSAQQSNSLTIAGQSGSANVIRIDGRNYVDLEDLARLANGSLSFSGNQIMLSLPCFNSGPSGAGTPTAGFSKEFVTAAVEMMARVREWHAALKNAIEHAYPLTADWLAAYNAQSQQSLRLAAVGVATGSDRGALPLLTQELNNMRKLSDKYLQMANSRTFIATDSLATDPLDQKILACGRMLASAATANDLVDDGSCR